MNETTIVHYDVVDTIGVITIDNPPVNALGPGVREGIIDALEQGNADDGVQAFVLIGAGRNFIAGADIRQFGKTRPIGSVVSAAALDASSKPVVAAIHGYALGGGLEHALACHYRLAAPGAKVGLPEVTLGIVPGGGGTQRLTRLIGPEAALDMVVSGRHMGAAEALKLGLLDAIVDEPDLRGAAIRHARSIASARPLPRARDRQNWNEADTAPAVFEARRKALTRKSRHLKAPFKAVDCIEAAVRHSFDDGLAFEQQAFSELEQGAEAKGLRYAFFAEREAAKIPGVQASADLAPVASAAVIGAGTMGSGIAIAYADAGIPVKLLEISPDALERGKARVRDTYATRVKRGSLTQQAMDACLDRIGFVQRYEDIADCDAVVEAVFERMDVKHDVFSKLDAVMKPGALLLTNSSALDIDEIASATRRPQDVAGAHFFAPANVMKLCEVVRGNGTAPDTLLRTMKMGRAMGKVCAVAGSCDGFVANRSRAPMMSEMMIMLEEGATPQQIDRVMTDFGYPMGPFAVNDLSGLDVSYEGRKRRAEANPDYRKLHVPDRLVEMGRLGQKTGAGWYRYEPGDRTPHPDAAVLGVIGAVARELGTAQREFTDTEILHRVLLASVNEACKILEDGKAYRASDIDVMWLYGFGFPRHRGGLMFWADTVGAKDVHAQITEWAQRYGSRWTPSRLLGDIAASGSLLRDATGGTHQKATP
ncbi:3-hydroxyacyl-CoA dehydrogenase NAD-binding domain-containing protein [Pigmentiphaga litoralis]|uniref:3-hydroxyacyl-CoA dehydrogenase n=1 Tax=Pigmentiphaga litoralis TaxID=516702 RepID=A0A7Y9LNF1_9BURK|nr:3-hydroxyacyl-CoA dehydrogenase NAD-binding domain-containing protein [Pigmentiphaga litoralis]NYE23150.1 3-hydroxyacyl-CoA dehydrogenase [Pigmentiphaga litoralis]NYE83235.1 3-hydroxyacyl-CoA dehydrogenase [Pigmentiphaga litoralis]